MKEKEKTLEKELTEIEASNLSDIKFKVMIIRMPKEFCDNFNKLSGNNNSMK